MKWGLNNEFYRTTPKGNFRGGKVKPLYIFVNGDSALRAGTFSTTQSVLSIRNGLIGIGGYGYMNIGGIDFSKYSTLKIVARMAGIQGLNILVGCNKTPVSANTATLTRAVAFTNTSFKEYSFDIKELEGAYFIFARTGQANMSSAEISDIWLEP